ATVVKMSPMRKAIARQLSHAKSTIPHYYLRTRVRLDPLIAMRGHAKAATGEAPSINDYLIRACALALRAHPDVNIQVHGEEIHRFAHADIAIAVATDKGLITPIIHAADEKTVAEIARQSRSLAARARLGRLKPEEFQGGSFSLSNLGMYGIEQFDAIINPPQGAILAVGAGVRTPVERDHALAFATVAALSLSCDHRAIDGAVGAAFLATLKDLIETPEKLTA
ncbi:MAG: 2-oxo acid dehydrogenase subunit E2, partial [Alphaproteobacteria bacterium]